MSNLKKKFKNFAISNEISGRTRGGLISINCRDAGRQIVTIHGATWEEVMSIVAYRGYTVCNYYDDGGLNI